MLLQDPFRPNNRPRATFGNDNGGGVTADSKKSALALPAPTRTRASTKRRMRKTTPRGNDQDVRSLESYQLNRQARISAKKKTFTITR